MEKGVIFSAFSFGSLFSFFGGVFAYKFGGATTMGVSVLIMAILEFLSPLFFRIHLIVFLVARAILGLLEVSISIEEFFFILVSIFSAFLKLHEIIKL